MKSLADAPVTANKPTTVTTIGAAVDDGRKQTLVAEEWDAGRLEVLKDAQVIGQFSVGLKAASEGSLETSNERQAEEYWICEIPSAEFSAGQFVIVSPLPGVRGDGTDGVRAPVSQLAK